VALFKIDRLVEQLHDIGVEPGGVLIVGAEARLARARLERRR
jgi:hypothetical protein